MSGSGRMRPRFALGALVLGLIAGGVFVTRFASFNNDAVDPELVRLLERVPFSTAGNLIEYVDFEVARRGPVESYPLDDGEATEMPLAFEWTPQLPGQAIDALTDPEEFTDSFGYGFDDIDGTLLFQGDEFGVFVVVDGNVVFQTGRREPLDPGPPNQDDPPTLADRAQLVAGLGLLDYDDLVGLSALFTPDNGLGGVAGSTLVPLVIVGTDLDGSHRIVLGFWPGADLDQIETGIDAFIDPTADATVEGSAPLPRTLSRSDDYIIVDVAPSTEGAAFRSNLEVRDLILEVFRLHPEILS